MASPTETTVEVVQDKVDDLAEKNVDSTDSDIRYMAYGARLRTALRAGTRYIAYTSDVGEAFRPVVPPWVVTAAYGVSWLYLSGDVAYESYKAHHRGPTPIEAANFSEPTRIGLAAVQRATFQSIASMALPAFTIHTAVRQSKKAFAKVQSPRLRAWGPTVTGLAIVPVLPFLFDHPVEYVTEHAFDWIRQKIIENNELKKVDGKRKDEL
ncbi:mitochondrial 18 KDa protein-domain-containing protein [Crucibulum laeve]|uniref:Mitochondrial fission process protein 1 n=1 Tax=Crucibulum laeve TaxID=68775 RepID=A0A5C3MFM9_9AGAR|nr:mitochondrial 18 KDa protein-domain-containing protein [Crucibulum laeve]